MNGYHENGITATAHRPGKMNGRSSNGVHLHTVTNNGTQHDGEEDRDGGQGDRQELFLRQIFDLLLQKGIKEASDPNRKVVEFEHPDVLLNKLDLELTDAGQSNKKLMHLCEETMKYSVKTGHPRFFNQLFSGQDGFALAGTWITETLNTSQYTFEVAPVFTLMEQVVLKKLRDLVGFVAGDGIFCPGGSVSNMYGLNLARYKKFPQVKTGGMQSLPRLCIFTSEQCHYSIKKGAALIGLGIDNVKTVPCDDRGKMDAAQLEARIQAAIQEGFHPFMVNATAGTTVIGAYDPLVAIADICERYDIWLHVDCCWGGGALMSSTHRHLLEGIERADSVAWNPHKMMGVPLQCCAFLTKHENLLQKCHSANADYLFQQDKFYDISYDTGDKSVQCGRKVDVFKLWLMWKAHGSRGFEANINHVFEMSRYLREKLMGAAGFRLVHADPECTNICFWYIPPSMRSQPENAEWWKKLGKVAPVIKERMVYEGTMLIGYNPLGSLVNFFRMVICNPQVSREDMDFVISEIDRLGSDL